MPNLSSARNPARGGTVSGLRQPQGQLPNRPPGQLPNRTPGQLPSRADNPLMRGISPRPEPQPQPNQSDNPLMRGIRDPQYDDLPPLVPIPGAPQPQDEGLPKLVPNTGFKVEPGVYRRDGQGQYSRVQDTRGKVQSLSAFNSLRRADTDAEVSS